jgi:alkylation response protein AidB-like acyl-CoA dehydrogenase
MPVSLRDMRFLIHDVFEFEAHYRTLNDADPLTGELLDTIIDEAARFTEGELEPLNRIGDEMGCTFDNGVVTTPSGFKQAYAKYVEGGWAALGGDPAYGGQGLPHSVSLFLEELMGSANMAWAMYPGLSRGVINALETHGSDEQKSRFLARLLTGEWTGTMCLTEPQAGSDVGLVRTQAEPLADGAYAVSGSKIFISAGEHDLAGNIVHLVLARLPDSPPGTRGISMFIVPKFDLDGERNAVVCGAIEEKMGIHGNATCVLHFDNARGYLVGEINSGMRNMFTMMNAARLVVGLQGICGAQAALHKATRYATERLQMRSLAGPKHPDKPADPLLVHPDIRRMLLTQRAIVEGGRALVYYTGQVADRAGQPAGEAQKEAQVLLDFLTPVVKGTLTELGIESANLAVQVFGGHGYIRETGVEQYVRDLRITTIYEGTTGIQGLDLLGRKVLQEQGAGLMVFLGEINELARQLEADENLAEMGAQLAALGRQWGELSLSLGARASGNLEEVGAAAVDFLFYSGYAALAYCWGRISLASSARVSGGEHTRQPGVDDTYLEGKLATARFYFARLLPRTLAHRAAIESGAGNLMAVSEAQLTAI